MRRFYTTTAEIFCPRKSTASSLNDADSSSIITGSQEILNRWRFHFQSFLKDHSNTQDNFLSKMPQYPIRHWMSLLPSFEGYQAHET